MKLMRMLTGPSKGQVVRMFGHEADAARATGVAEEARLEPETARAHASSEPETAEGVSASKPEATVVTVHSLAGGWYEIRLDGEVLDKVKGKKAAEARAAELGRE